MKASLSKGIYVILRPAAEVLHNLSGEVGTWPFLLPQFPHLQKRGTARGCSPCRGEECLCLSPKMLQCLPFARSLLTPATTPQCVWAEGSRGNSWPSLPANCCDSEGGFGPCVCVLEVGLQQALAQRAPLRGCSEHGRRECKPSSPFPLLAVQKTPRATGHRHPGPHLWRGSVHAA